MNPTLDERHEIWRRFLQRWPVEALDQMTLAQFAQSGDQDSFSHWVETVANALGPTGSSSPLPWSNYLGGGEGAEVAFEKLLATVVQIARAARTGDMASLEKADLDPVAKWKLAFLYQHSEAPCVLPLYEKQSLQAISGPDARTSFRAMQSQLLAERGERDVLAYGDTLWKRIQEAGSAPLDTGDAYSFLNSSEQYEQTRHPTKTMSWFRTVTDGREIALARDNRTPTLYLSPGAWLDDRLRARLISFDPYPADRKRTGSIRDGARSLDEGNPIVKVNVPTRAVLIALCDAYAGNGKNNDMKTSSDAMKTSEFDSLQPLNQILFGPPGTGKTFATVDAALAILDPGFAAKHAADRKALKARFDTLAKEQRVRFVTFHQSFSYEDFVEGLRAHSDNDCLQYRVESGVFQQICDDANKIPESYTLDDTLDELLEELAVKAATATTPKGQSFQVSYRPGNDTVSCLPARSETGAPLPANIEHIRSVLHQRPVARMYCESYVRGVAEMVKTRHKTAPGGSASVGKKELPHVLIIDEINRGNVSRIFGELITLIEPSKRAGADEALEVVLPYSKKPFSVPGNVYLIGTMNTADRSLASLDVALRRRFEFQAMPPQPELLDGTVVGGVVVGQLLRTMNQRIEALLDRDHCLGHAYFIPLRDDPSLARLGSIFRNQVLPLLQEYFFDDWQRIQWVLNDHRKPRELQFVQSTGVNAAELFGAEVNVARSPQIWAVNANAFTQVGSYLGIVDHAKATGVQ